jgi:carbonic anhydrase
VDIDATRAQTAQLPALAVHFQSTPSTRVNNGHTIQDSLEPGDFIQLGDARFELEQFHFHHPSEHTLGGAHLPLEIHFVHRSASGGKLVMAVFVSEGSELQALHPLFDHLPPNNEPTRLATDPSALLPPDRRFVEYEGSLTTPPCSEGVTWLVLTTPITASPDQIRQFAVPFPHNNRPLMPLNGRRVLSNQGP